MRFITISTIILVGIPHIMSASRPKDEPTVNEHHLSVNCPPKQRYKIQAKTMIRSLKQALPNKTSPWTPCEDPILATLPLPRFASVSGLMFTGQSLRKIISHSKELPEGSGYHTAFSIAPHLILPLIDEAWTREERICLTNNPGAYSVPMGKVIGTRGETSLRIILSPGTLRVVTVFPTSDLKHGHYPRDRKY